MQAERVKRVYLVDDFEVYGYGLARMVRRRLAARGVKFAGRRPLRAHNANAVAGAIRRSQTQPRRRAAHAADQPGPRPTAYPPAAQAFYAAFRSRYGKEAEPYALQGYEAMSVTLDAIRRAGAKGNDRASVVAAFRATRDRDSVLGRYSIDPNGDTTLSTYGVLRIGPRGRLVYDRTIDSSR